jgi:hypothetical protein
MRWGSIISIITLRVVVHVLISSILELLKKIPFITMEIVPGFKDHHQDTKILLKIWD